jgi:glycosyltransferase involved in cell wall biosynthesis
MRIAMVAPLFELVPPSQYGGTERVVYFMVEELVRLGHIVTLYAARGSQTSGQLIECWDGTFRAQGIGCSAEETREAYTAQIKLAMSGIVSHDIVHIHHAVADYHPMVLESLRGTPVVWTDHNSVHDEGKPGVLSSLAKLDIGLTALSNSHRSTVPDANWLATIHHGLPRSLLTPKETAPSYLAFLGRISPEKGITTAVRIAKAAALELKVAAKLDKADQAFFDEEVEPLFAASQVDWIGEICDTAKAGFLSAAIALIFPIQWLEPFGLVMIEAMACGCPVIAFGVGSVPEVLENGVTGFVVHTEEEAVEALRHIGSLDRRRIRQSFEERFTSTTMAKKYVEVYERTIQESNARRIAQETKASNDAQAATLRENFEYVVVDSPYSEILDSFPLPPVQQASARLKTLSAWPHDPAMSVSA